MKKTLLLLVFLTINLISHSQENYSSDSYTVSLNDINSKTFEKDSTANALVIYELGNSYVDKNDFLLKTEIQKKIKILTRDGFDQADIAIHLYNNKNNEETVEKILATTYNLIDGKVTKTQLEESNIFKETHDENHKIVKFALPNIKVGSVITYSYTLSSPFMFNYKGWHFQDVIPKLHSEYQASIPGNYEYNIKLVGGRKLTTNKSEVKKNCLQTFNGGVSNCGVYQYVMENIPAFIEEDYMTSKANYLAKIEYELKTIRGFDGRIDNYTKTWETVDHEFKTDKDIGRQLSKSIDAEELLSPDIINEPDPLKKAKRIYDYVQDNYTWNEEYRIFKDVSVKDLIKNKSGNVSSINILLHNLLEAVGIDVKPVLLSTRNNGFATKIFPIISDFNYLIVSATINNKTYLLDATDDYLSFGQLPYRCLNQYGRLMDFKNGSQWIDINPDAPSNILFKAELHIDDNQNFSGIVDTKYTGYHALQTKKSYYTNKQDYVKKLQDNSPFIDIFDHQVTSEDQKSPEFMESYQIEYKTDAVGERIFLNPFFMKFFNENPFKLQERTYPVDFGYKSTYYYMLTLNFGDGYTVLEQPKNILLKIPNDAGQISFSSKILDKSIHLLMKIDFKKTIYAPEYYPYLKEFLSKIVDIQKNSLILLKKT